MEKKKQVVQSGELMSDIDDRPDESLRQDKDVSALITRAMTTNNTLDQSGARTHWQTPGVM